MTQHFVIPSLEEDLLNLGMISESQAAESRAAAEEEVEEDFEESEQYDEDEDLSEEEIAALFDEDEIEEDEDFDEDFDDLSEDDDLTEEDILELMDETGLSEEEILNEYKKFRMTGQVRRSFKRANIGTKKVRREKMAARGRGGKSFRELGQGGVKRIAGSGSKTGQAAAKSARTALAFQAGRGSGDAKTRMRARRMLKVMAAQAARRKKRAGKRGMEQEMRVESQRTTAASLLEDVQGIVTSLDEERIVEAYRGFSLIAETASRLSSALLYFAEDLDEDVLDDLAESILELSKNAEEVAQQIEDEEIDVTDVELREYYEAQLAALFEGLEVYEELREDYVEEGCGCDSKKSDSEDDEEEDDSEDDSEDEEKMDESLVAYGMKGMCGDKRGMCGRKKGMCGECDSKAGMAMKGSKLGK